MNTKWEYQTLSFKVSNLTKLKETQNELGLQGWELVAMIPIESKEIGFFDSGSATSALIVTFKRPLEV